MKDRWGFLHHCCPNITWSWLLEGFTQPGMADKAGVQREKEVGCLLHLYHPASMFCWILGRINHQKHHGWILIPSGWGGLTRVLHFLTGSCFSTQKERSQ